RRASVQARTCPARRSLREARRATWPRAAPTPRACGTPARVASTQPSLVELAVRVDPPVAQERPVAAHFVHAPGIHLADQNRLLRGPRLGHDLPERIGQELRPPELQPAL